MKPLTQSEIAALKLVAEGKTQKECGFILGVSRQSVVSRMKKIFKKVGAINTPHAIARAFQIGILTALMFFVCAASINPIVKPVILSPKSTEIARTAGASMAVPQPPEYATVSVIASWSSPSNGVRIYLGTNSGNYFTNFYAATGTNLIFKLKWPLEFPLNYAGQSTNGGLVSALTTNFVWSAPVPNPVTNVILSAASPIGQVWLSRTLPLHWMPLTNVPGTSAIVKVGKGSGMWLFGAAVPLSIRTQ